MSASVCAGLWLCLVHAAVAQDQFVVTETTYTATAQNTSDSHYRVDPLPGTPANWRSPIDYAGGTAYARLEVLEKPSTRKTLYNICFEATPSYACMGYSPAYQTPGVYEFSFPFSTFYQYSSVDWSKGVRKIALILKDENGTKKQGDPAFYPTKVRITITIVRAGGSYEPPDAMEEPEPALDAAIPADAASMAPRDAGAELPEEQPSAGASAPPQLPVASAAGTSGAGRGGMAGGPGAGASAPPRGNAAGAAPNAAPSVAGGAAAPALVGSASGTENASGSCAIGAGAPMPLPNWLWLLLTSAVLCRRRASARQEPRTREDSDG